VPSLVLHQPDQREGTLQRSLGSEPARGVIEEVQLLDRLATLSGELVDSEPLQRLGPWMGTAHSSGPGGSSRD